MPFKTPTPIHESIVIGHTLPALVFGYINNYPIISNSHLNTSPFDYCSPELNLSSFGILNEVVKVSTPDGSINRGISKLDVEAAIILHMSIAGLLLNSVPLLILKSAIILLSAFLVQGSILLVLKNFMYSLPKMLVD